ncbi:MAG TPA: hypothetical protein VEC99_13570 [Clostridia bacterium]|nr:hypothetical protein [Clostridia bacterium]
MIKHPSVLLAATLLVLPYLLHADLIEVGDSQVVTLNAQQNGDPKVDLTWGVPIKVTAGTYHFHLEDSYWNFGIYGWRNEVVGGVLIYDTNLNILARNPMVEGKDPNLTVRDLDFYVPCDQTLLAGVADNYISDNGGSAIFALTKTGNPATPVIEKGPVSITVSPGDIATFTVIASSSLPLGFQWRFNNTEIPGATNAVLTIPSVSTTDVGSYDTMVINAFGTNISNPARLAILDLKRVAAVFLDGPVGSNYRIEFTPAVEPADWQVLTNITIPSRPYIYVDYESSGKPERFYRATPILSP